jgi:hypothetical protein
VVVEKGIAVKIHANVTSAQGGRPQGVAAGDQTAWQLAWRRELERAQRWEVQRPHTSDSASQHDRRSQPGDDAPLAPSTAPTIEDAASATAEVKPMEQGQDGSGQAMHSTVREGVSAAVPRGPQAPLDASFASVASSPHAIEGRDPLARGAELSAAASLEALVARMERAAWLPRAAHVNVQGSRVSVALRDAELSEQELSDLLWRVRKEVESFSFELGTLVVNGRLVQAARE